MYNPLAWEEDITRVCTLKPVGISSSEGISTVYMEKRVTFTVLWMHFWVSLCAWVNVCIVVSERMRKMKERERMREMLNIWPMLLCIYKLVRSKCKCEHNLVLAFQSSDVCTQTLKLQKASWKHRPNSAHIDCILAV